MINKRRKGGSSDRFPLLELWNHCRRWLQWNQKMTASWQEICSKHRHCVEKQRHYSANKGPYSQGYGLPSGHIRLWDLDHKEGRDQKPDAFELCWRRLLRVPWIARRSNKSIVREINPEYSLEWLMLKLQYFGKSDANSWLIGKVPDAGKDRGQKEKRVSKDEMAGWNHQCSGHELGQTSGDGEGQGGLACCSPWGHKEPDTSW